MTSARRPAPHAQSPAAAHDGAVVEMVRRLVAVLDDRMTPAGHPYALVMSEHRGTCPPYECSLRCQEYRALFVEAQAWLEAHEPARQLALLSEVERIGGAGEVSA